MSVDRLLPFRNFIISGIISETEATHIVNELEMTPMMGHAVIRLFTADTKYPLAGFLRRSWKFRRNTEFLECCTLHRFTGTNFPIQVFDVSICLAHDAPWQSEDELFILRAIGLVLHEAELEGVA